MKITLNCFLFITFLVVVSKCGINLSKYIESRAFEKGYHACVEYHRLYGNYGSMAFRNEAFNWQNITRKNIPTIKSIAEKRDRNVWGITEYELNDISSDVNTIGKYPGKMMLNEDLDQEVFATGSEPNATWVSKNGTVTNTPT